jgi:hypothetical protein
MIGPRGMVKARCGDRALRIAELEQFDRLLQLRRHHQRGGLPPIEALGYCHGSSG